MLGETEIVNKHILENIKIIFLPRTWNDWPLYITNLDKYKIDYKKELPEIATCALITSNQGIDRDLSINSGLVVFWFQEKIFHEPVEEILKEIENINWEKHAKNWEW